MLEKFYTRRKTKVADVADNQDESVYNFPVEVEVERPTNTFKQGSNKYFFRSSYSEKAKLPVTSGSSGWQGQQPAMGRPHDQNQVSMWSSSLKPGMPRQNNSVNKSNQRLVAIKASRVRLGQHYCRFPEVSFTPKWIEIKTIKGNEGSPISEWPLEELCSFESYYNFHSDSTEDIKAVVGFKFHKRRKDGRYCADICSTEDDLATSFVMEVDNEEWCNHQREIFSMSEKYKAVWKRLTRIAKQVAGTCCRRMSRDEAVELKGRLSRSPLKELSSNIQAMSENISECHPQIRSPHSRPNQELQMFDTLVFPQDDPDAVTITRKDVEILRPMGLLNDTIIDFYVKYLQSKVPQKDQGRFFFFNSFFFRKLVDSRKNSPDTDHGKVDFDFERVRKWTRKVNLFEKDYIFIPVNQSLHWSLIIICHLGGLDRTPDESMGTPCILHLDSLEGSHAGVEEHIRRYIEEIWMRRKIVSLPDNSGRMPSHMQFIEAKVPQQNNHCDCGTYLLHYVELFLRAAPLHFSLARSQGFPYFLTKVWFKSSEISGKRCAIQNLLCELYQASLLSASNNRAAISSSKLTRPQAEMSATGYLHELDDGDDEENDEVILVEEIANITRDKSCPSTSIFSASRNGSDAHAMRVRPEESPLLESSTRCNSAGQPSLVDTKFGSNGIMKFFPVVSGNDDMQSYRKKQKVTVAPSDWEEDTVLEIVHEDQTQRMTEVDIVGPPSSHSKPCVRNISKYFSSVQNCDIFDIVSGS